MRGHEPSEVLALVHLGTRGGARHGDDVGAVLDFAHAAGDGVAVKQGYLLYSRAYSFDVEALD